MRVALLAVATMMTVHSSVDAAERHTRILLLCTGNSARSQMAEGVLKSLDSTLDVQSAGTAPAARVNPHAIQAMKEIGIDISGEHPKHVQQFVKQSFDYVITVCDDADKNCPVFSGKVGTRAHIGFPDPAEAQGAADEIMNVFREVRDDIRTTFTAYYRGTIANTARQSR
jgi:arsenate reductase